MVNEPNHSVFPALLNFFEQYLCVRPRNWQAWDRRYVLSEGTVGVLIRGESRGGGISWIYGKKLD